MLYDGTDRTSVPCLAGAGRSSLALLALPFEAQKPGDASPQAFLQSIYDPYLKAGFQGPAFEQVNRFFVPKLARAIDADMREAKRRGEVPKLDGDPFVDAQDWEIENLAISVKADGPKATGEVAFENLGKPTRITLDLVQTRPAGASPTSRGRAAR